MTDFLRPAPARTASGPLPALALACALVAAAAWLPATAQAFSLNFSTGDNTQVRGKGQMVEGSGHVSEQTRAVAAYSKLRIEGPLDVVARPATSPSAKVRVDDNLQALVQLVADGDTLVVRLAPDVSLRTKNPMRVELGFTQLASVALRGSGDVVVEGVRSSKFDAALAGSGDLALRGLAVGDLAVSLAGSGDLVAAGTASRVSATLAGSGDLSTRAVTTPVCEVSVAGSGDAEVFASQRLKASVAGSGDIVYHGNPAQVDKNVVGSGDVSRGG